MNLNEENESAAEKERLGIEGFQNLIIRKALSVSTNISELSAQERQKILDDPTTRHNDIYLHWPRSVSGKPLNLDLDGISGRETTNGLEMWGSTRLDFYTVAVSGKKPNVVISSSGSKLAAWMKANGEDTYAPAKVLMKRAEEEQDPVMITPCDIAELVKDGENLLGSEKSWARNGPRDGKKQEDWELPKPWPPKSVFSSEAYPKPWPMEAFTRDPFTRFPTIQQYLQHSHLPQKLIIHDPWKLLERGDPTKRPGWDQEKNIPWSKMVDIQHIYKLTTSLTNTSRKASDDKEGEEAEQKLQRDRLNFLVNAHTNVLRENVPTGMQIHIEAPKPGPAKPPLYVVLPVIPERRVPAEAHLYISPGATVSQGKHSIVYKAEWEIPRNVLVKECICPECVVEDAMKILAEQDGKDGERRDPKWDALSGAFIIDKEDTEDDKISIVYRGPFRPIESRVQMQDLARGPYCIHIQKTRDAIHPLTTKVYVAAKIATGDGNDERLEREAENYQAFPRHFFEHWSGYNLVPPLKYPVPVVPLVPQFYGYYVADPTEKKNTTKNLGPILLQEYCGGPSAPTILSADDQTLITSLIYRFQKAGWIHGVDAFQGHVLRQSGPLSDWPGIGRMDNAFARHGFGKEWSYRLVDFGESFEMEDNEDGREVERNMERMVKERKKIQKWVSGKEK